MGTVDWEICERKERISPLKDNKVQQKTPENGVWELG
jgi:hypothetical protein